MNETTSERLDFLLSAALDGELTANEEAELDALVAAHPEAAARRAEFEAVDSILQEVAADASGRVSSAGNRSPSAGLENLLARIESDADLADPLDELASRRAQQRARMLPLLSAAAAALALYFLWPTTGDHAPPGMTPPAREDVAREDPTPEDPMREGSTRESPSFAETPSAPSPAPNEISEIESLAEVDVEGEALALFWALDAAEGDGIDLVGATAEASGVSRGDLEVIEQLELMEFLAARSREERG